MSFYLKNNIPIHTIPSLQGTLAKHTNPTLRPNFAKEPFHPSHSNAGLRDSASLIHKLIESKNRQCLTANIIKLGVSGLTKVRTFNKIFNGLINKWLGNPSLLILANRYLPL